MKSGTEITSDWINKCRDEVMKCYRVRTNEEVIPCIQKVKLP